MSRPENLLEELKKAYAQWESLYKQGGSDPFYPDGVNLNWCGTTSFTSNGKSRKPSLCTRILKCTGENCLPR